MKIWAFSDTHGKHGFINTPADVDMAIFAGDAGMFKNPRACLPDYLNFLTWYGNLDIPYKIMINGNHCTAFEQGFVKREDIPPSIIYLENESVTLEGIKIYGSPQTLMFYNWAYNVRSESIGKYWDAIPDDTDILVTHSPPHNILDRCADGYRAGCHQLESRVLEVKPRYHIFGHIHEDGGKTQQGDGTVYVNASVLNEDYQVSNDGITISYDI